MASEDVAAAILYAVTAPPHVNINEILMRPRDQET
jgi:NADP-dependent 3-hydroxy acid dehydrogenase YdfG